MEQDPELEVYSVLLGGFFFFFCRTDYLLFFDISVLDEFFGHIPGVPFRSKLPRAFY